FFLYSSQDLGCDRNSVTYVLGSKCSLCSRPDTCELRFLRPLMLRIPPRQFFSNLWIEPLPKSAEIRGHLHRPVIRRKQVHHNRRTRYFRRLAHAEKVLKPRFDPWRFTGLVI